MGWFFGLCHPELREDGRFRKAERQFVRSGFTLGFWRGAPAPERERKGKRVEERGRGRRKRYIEIDMNAHF